MECKNFYGTTFNFVMHRKLEKQAKRPLAHKLMRGFVIEQSFSEVHSRNVGYML